VYKTGSKKKKKKEGKKKERKKKKKKKDGEEAAAQRFHSNHSLLSEVMVESTLPQFTSPGALCVCVCVCKYEGVSKGFRTGRLE